MATNLYDDALESLDQGGAPGTPPTPPNPYEDTLALQDQGRETQLRRSVLQGRNVSPDRAAESKRLSQQVGLPATVVDRNFDRFKTDAHLDDVARIGKASPHLGEWLATDPNNAAVAQDDLPTLSAMERTLQVGRGLAGAVPAGLAGFGGGMWRLLQGAAEAAGTAAGELMPIGAFGFAPTIPLGAITAGLDRVVRGTPTPTVPGQLAAGNIDLYAQPKVKNPDGSISTVHSFSVNIDDKEVLLPTVMPDGRHLSEEDAIKEYEKTGRHLGMFETPEAATAYAQRLHEDYAAGTYDQPRVTAQIADFARGSALIAEHLQQRIAGDRRGAGFVESAVYSGLESIGQMLPGLVLGPFAGVGAAAGVSAGVAGATTAGQAYGQAREQGVGVGTSLAFSGFQGAVEVATEYIPAHKLFADVAKHTPLVQTVMHQVLPELTTENVATILQDFGEWAVLPANKDRTITDYLRERPSQAVATTISTLVAVGGTAAAGHAAARFFGDIGTAAQESKTVQRSPEAAQSFIEQATKDGPLSHVYAPIDTFTTYWQSKGVDPRQIATELTGDAQAYDTAVATSQDLVIPTAAYAVKLAGTEHNTFFQNELRLAPDQMNARESQALEQQMSEQAQVQAPPATTPIRDSIVSQLETAGMPRETAESHASLYEATFHTLAQRAGLDPVELYQRYGLQVQRPDLVTPAGEGTQLAQEPPPTATFLGYQPNAEGGAEPLFNITGGPRDRSTVTTATLEAEGIPVPTDLPTVEQWLAQRRQMPLQTLVPETPIERTGVPMASRLARLTDAAPPLAAPETGASAALDVNAPIDLSDPVAAAQRMRQENPNIDRQARELGERARASRTPAPPRAVTETKLYQAMLRQPQEGIAPTQTPAFKNWFGDWELARLEGSLRSVRGSARAKTVAQDFVGTPLTNRETGLVATVSGESLRKMLSKSAVDNSSSPQAHMMAVGNLDQLFPLATRRVARESVKDPATVAQIHVFDVPMPFAGQLVKVTILAKEFRRQRDGARLYAVQAVEVGTSGSVERGQTSDRSPGRSSLSPPDIPVDRFTQMAAAVNGEGVSKIVNEDGTPRVVYHGTAADFDTFDVKKAGTTRGAKGEKALFFSLTPETANHSASVAGSGNAEQTGQFFAAKMLNDALGIEFPEEGSVVYPVYLKLENPFISSMEFYNGKEMTKEIARAKKLGHDGIMFTNLKTYGEADTVAVFSPTQVKSATGNVGAFDPTSPNILEQKNRGAITFGADRQFTIDLLAKADLSTFLHESGHFFLEVMQDLAQDSPAVQGDLETLRTWFEQQTGSREISTEQHEAFARGFESYLMEGKAPSIELRSVFARFRAWLLGVYRTLKGLNVTLTPEVRGVFDRMLATDEAIAAAQQDGQQQPLWLTPQTAGMTPEQFERYRGQIADASRQARETLERQVLAEVQRTQTDQWKTERAAIEDTVTNELHDQPVYRALAAMQKGTHPNGSALVDGAEPVPMKLSRDAIVDQFGEERLKTLPRPYVYTREGGVHPDTVADLYGFSSGDELLTAISQAPKLATAIQQETDRRMLAEHGSLLLDGTLPEKAQAAVANDSREAVIRAELETLAKIRRGGPSRLRAALPQANRVRAFAEARIAATRVSEVRPPLFWSAARRAAGHAVELALKGDVDGAIVSKQQELVNLALYREAVRAREDIESRVGQARQLSHGPARARLGLAGQTYLDQVDGILDRYDFARVSQKALDRRARIRDWVDALTAQGLPADSLPAAVLDDARRVNYREVSYAELQGVTDGLQQIAHLARLKNRLLKAAGDRDFTAVRDGVVASIRDHNEVQPLPIEFRPGDEKWQRVGAWFASHAKISMLARVLDGHQDGGAMWESFIRPLNEAAAAEVTRKTEVAQQYGEVLERAYPGRELAKLHDKQFIPAINDSLSKEGRLAVALNWGNETSRERLLSDRSRGWNQAQVAAILDTLDARDWRFVQDTWDFVDQFWPEVAAKQQRVTGLAPEKVEAVPVETRFGTFPGGYYPLAYDGRLSARAKGFEPATQAKLVVAASYVHATTRRGHVESRVQHVQLPVRLELGVMFHHLDQVIHDLTHHETLIDTTRLLRDGQIADALYTSSALGAKGEHLYQQFSSALQDIALDTMAGSSKPGVLDTAANFLRTRTQIAGMAWNLWTALQQPIGLFNGMSRVGPQWVARGMKHWLRDAVSMENTATWIGEVSPMMRERVQTATQDLHDIRQALRSPGGWFDSLVRTVTADKLTQQTILDGYLWHIGLAQRVADIPTWLGAYEKAMAGGEAEPRAIALADQAVLDSQGGGQIKDLAQIQRGSPVAKLFMTFYSYGNTVYNAAAERASATNFKSPAQVLTFLGHLSLLGIMPAVLTEALRCATGRGRCQDWPHYLQNVAGQLLGDTMNSMVLLREAGGAVKIAMGLESGTRGYEGPAALRPFEMVTQLGQQIQQGEADAGFFRALDSVAGLAFKYPAAQVQRTVDGAIALEQGKTKNPAALLFGPPAKKAAGQR